MKKSIILIVLIGLIACQPKGRIFVEHKELSPNLQWFKKDVRQFEVNIEDNSMLYNLSIAFRYINGYPYQTLRIAVTEVSPSGQETKNEYDLKVREDNGDYIGDPALDIWDTEHLVEVNKSFKETGVYKYEIEHIMPVDPVNFVMEIGLILDKSQ